MKQQHKIRRSAVRSFQVSLLALAVAHSFTAMAQGTSNPAVGDPVRVTDDIAVPTPAFGAGVAVPALTVDTSNLPSTHAADMASANARVGKVSVSVDKNNLPADGETQNAIHISVIGKDGLPLAGEVLLTVQVSGGTLGLPGIPASELNKGILNNEQTIVVKAVNGVAVVVLNAPIEPQDVQVRVTAGTAQAKGTLSYLPEQRSMVGVGLVEGIIRFNSGKGAININNVGATDGFEREIKRFGRTSDNGKRSYGARAAFFLKGKIKGDVLLTAAYDSDKDTGERMFRDINPEDYYPVYGDASVKGFDARSNSKLYVRVDKNKSYMLWGDFNTGTGFSQMTGGGAVADITKRDLGNYSRSMTGARAHFESDNGVVAVNAFGSKDSLKQVVEEFPAFGMSGPFTVSNRNGIEGTEKLEIITRDRNQPSLILNVQPLVRFVDYSFEPFAGRVMLKQALSSVDSNGNPMSLRAVYEVEQGGEKFWIYGADAQVKVAKGVEVGASYVKDKNPYAPYELASANATVQFGENTALVAEYAHSESAVAGLTGSSTYTIDPSLVADGGDKARGDAWRVEVRHQDERIGARAYYGKSDAEFNNPSASLSRGREEAGLKLTARINDRITAYLNGTLSRDTVYGARRNMGEVGVDYKVNDKLNLDFGLVANRQRAGSYGSSLSVATPFTAPLAGDWYNNGSAIDPVSGGTLSNVGGGWYGSSYGTGNSTYDDNYTGLRLRATYRPTSKIDLMAEYQQSLRSGFYPRASLGAAYRFSDLGRAYAKYEWATGLSAPDGQNSKAGELRSNAFVFGIDTQYMPGGTVFSEYRLRDEFGGRNMQAASGLRNTWNLSDKLRLNTAAEYLHIFGGDGQKATALSAGLEYRPNDLWAVTNRLEWRRLGDSKGSTTTYGYDTWLSAVTVARKLNQDWTALARNYYLRTDRRGHGVDAYENRFQVGVAYRDSATNRMNALAKYEFWTSRDDTGLGTANSDVTGYRKHIFSIHADYHPERKWWMTGRLAGKWQKDTFDGRTDSYSAMLAAGRVNYDITPKWDVSVLAAGLYSPKGSNATQYAAGIETGYQVAKNLWFSAGYNFRGFNASDMAGSEYTQKGAFLRLRYKFDEETFGFTTPEKPMPAIVPVFKPQVINLSADGLFAFGKSSLSDMRSEGVADLEALAAELKGLTELTSISVIGHTDRIGSPAANLLLSQRRAETIKAFFVSKGIDANLVSTRGMGLTQPVVECKGPKSAKVIACLQANRRVEIMVNGSKTVQVVKP